MPPQKTICKGARILDVNVRLQTVAVLDLATGFNFFTGEVQSKVLSLLHELVPKAIRVGVLVNSANAATAEANLREVREAASALGLQIEYRRQPDDRHLQGWLRSPSAHRPPETHARHKPPESGRALPAWPIARGSRRRTRRQSRASARSRTSAAKAALISPIVLALTTWQHPQGRQARRTARSTGRQVRLRHQPGNREAARHRGAAATPRHRHRGDRVIARINRREMIALFGAATWPLAAGAKQSAKPVST
jgi:hypothetical protein